MNIFAIYDIARTRNLLFEICGIESKQLVEHVKRQIVKSEEASELA